MSQLKNASGLNRRKSEWEHSERNWMSRCLRDQQKTGSEERVMTPDEVCGQTVTHWHSRSVSCRVFIKHDIPNVFSREEFTVTYFHS